MNAKTLSHSFLLVLTVLSLANLGRAQTPIASGELADGTISTAGETDSWSFDANTGDSVVLRVGAKFVPEIRLFGPDGAELGDAFTASSVNRDAVLQVQTTNSGSFLVVVGSYYPNGTGDYSLSLAKAPGAITVSAGDEGGALTNGFQHTGTIPIGDLDTWNFSANAGDSIVLRMGAKFVPWILLYGPDGSQVGEAFTASSVNRDADLAYQATNSGTFTVVVGSYYRNGSGDYILTLGQSPEPFVQATGDEGGPLDNGAQHRGTLEIGDLDLWSFPANAGDSVLLRLGGVGFVPWIRVYGPDGSPAGEAHTASSVNRDARLLFQATNSGMFTVVVSSFYLGGSGDYLLNLAKSPGSFVVSTDDEGGAITNGVKNTGSLQIGDMDLWTFDANAGDGIVARIGAVGFVPELQLFGPDGTLAGEAFTASSVNRDANLMLQIPNSGTYTLVASSVYLGGNGDYILTLAQSPGDFVVSPGDEGGALTNGFQHSGMIEIGDIDLWRLDASAGNSLVLRMGATGFVPRIQLYGPDGMLVDDAFTASSVNRDAELYYQVTNSGSYTVVASSYYFNGSGSYILTLAQTPGLITVAPGDEGGPVTNAFTHIGALGIGDLEVFTFYGTVGDSNLLHVAATNFTPWIRVFGPDGSLVGQAFTASSVNRSATYMHVVTNEGPYTVLVSSYYSNGTGTYSLRQSRVPPDLIVPPDTTLDEGMSLNVSISAMDPEIPLKPLTFALVAGPPGLMLSANGATNANLTWPTSESSGPSTNLVVVSVTDLVMGQAFIRTNMFTVVVNELNTAPTLAVPSDETIDEITPWSGTAMADDVDIPANVLTFTLLSPPTGMTIDPNTGDIEWTPGEDQGPSTNTITVVVTDDNPTAVNTQHLSATNSFTLIVRENNRPPQLVLPTAQVIDEGSPLTASASGMDPDLPANSLTFALLSPPAGMTIDPASGAISWTPTEAQGPSTNNINVVLMDNNPWADTAQQISVTNSFLVTVREVNTRPVLPTLAAQLTIAELSTLTLTNTASDSDDPPNALGYALLEAPTNATISATGVISWTPSEEQGPSTNTFTTVVTDTNTAAVASQSLTTTNTILVIVTKINTAPILTAPSDQSIDELTLLHLNAGATDSDVPTNQLTFSLLSPPAGLTIDPVTGSIDWTPTEAQGPSTNIITVVVEDSNPAAPVNSQIRVTNTFTITVNESNSPPVLQDIAAQSLHFGMPLSVQAVATDDDIPTNHLTFTLQTPPSGMMIDADSGAISWTPAEAQVGTYTVTVQVTDDGAPAKSEMKSFEVNVTGSGSSLEIHRLPGQLIQIIINGDVGLDYELQYSTNLTNWNQLLRFNLPSSPYPYVDPSAATNNVRFYQLKLNQ